MPTIYKARLTEPETPMLEIWNRMFKGLVVNTRAILDCLGYYAERDLQVQNQESELTQEEEEELKPIARALRPSGWTRRAFSAVTPLSFPRRMSA